MTEEQKIRIQRIIFWKREIKDIEFFIKWFGESDINNKKPFFEKKISFHYIPFLDKKSIFPCSDIIATGFLDYMRE